ncbi:MAG: DUF4287 domain-containing protein [Myxococcales bacterium]|nr:DUF4287 domain-containing protein [Myxococcales bacterium]
MTDSKKLKRRVRARAARTGESYTAARRHVVAQVDAARQERTAEAAATARAARSTGAVSEEATLAKTGHGFDHWFGVLDRFGAPDKGHTASARHLREDHGVSPWYAQSISIAYERARGLRVLNQATAGSFQVSVSRTLPTDLQTATPFLTDAARRPDWWEAVGVELPPEAFRRKEGAVWVRFRHDDGAVEVRLWAMEDGRCKAVARIEQLPDSSAVERHRARYRQALDALERAVSRGSAPAAASS